MDNEGKSPSRQKRFFQTYLDEHPMVKAVCDFFYEEGKGVKSGWAVFLFFVGGALWSGYEWGEDSANARLSAARDENAKITRENDNLIRDNQLLIQKNTSLEQTVAPLLARAAKEFPGEEINTSLKKIVDKLEKQDPLLQPLASVVATVEVLVKSDESQSVRDMTSGFVAFGKGDDALLLSNCTEVFRAKREDGKVEYFAQCSTDVRGDALGKPISDLQRAEYIQASLRSVPEDALILGGKISITLNGAIRLELQIPAQVAKDRNILIRDLSAIKKSLMPLSQRPPPASSSGQKPVS